MDPQRQAAVRAVSSIWWVLLVVGIIFLSFGIVMLFDVAAGATAVAVIIGAFLIFDGIIEIVTGGRTGGSRALAVILGIVLVAGGIISIVWPGVTLLVIALVFGITLLVGGLARAIGALVLRGPAWGWLFFLGALETIVGVLAIAWPHVTAYVILVLIGIYAIVAGLAQIVLSFELKRAPERLGV